MPPSPERSITDVVSAGYVVFDEWYRLGRAARLLGEAANVRTDSDNAAMDSAFVHARCLINFLCGNYIGEWGRTDIKPADFLGYEWFPDDAEDFDKELRGRLRVMNKQVVHATWDRVSSTEVVLWSMIVVAHRVSWAMRMFTAELERSLPDSEVALVVAPTLRRAWEEIEPMLPPIDRRTGETPIPPAPDRKP